MEQKSYKWELVEALRQRANHSRALAEQLRTNPMTISRKLRALLKENVLDYRQEGKNKVYFLKKTTEAKLAVFMTEHYKLLRALQQYPRLRKIIDAIRKNHKVQLAVLFGSYAKGLAKKESDIDVFIMTNQRNIKKEVQELDSKLSIKIGVYDPTNPLIKEIEKNHIILKGVEIYYETNKFFG